MPALLESPLFQALDDDGNPVAGGLLYTYLPGSSTSTPVYHDAGLTTAWTNPVQLDAAGQALIYFGAPIKLTVTDANDVALFTVDPVLPPTTDPAMLESISATVPEYQAQTDPGELGTESLPSSLEGELERLRYRIAEISGMPYWYQTGTGIRAQSLTQAALPSPGTIGRLASVSDQTRGLWSDTGSLWARVEGDVVNVQLFGATGDGVSDDTAAIQAALNACHIVAFPTGTYRTGPLTLRHATEIWLQRATLQHNGVAGAMFTTDGYNLTVRGMMGRQSVLKPVAGSPAIAITGNYYQDGTGLTERPHFHAEHVGFDGGTAAVYADHGTGGGMQWMYTIDNCDFVNQTNFALYLGPSVFYTYLSRCYARDVYGFLKAYDNTETKIYGCTVEMKGAPNGGPGYHFVGAHRIVMDRCDTLGGRNGSPHPDVLIEPADVGGGTGGIAGGGVVSISHCRFGPELDQSLSVRPKVVVESTVFDQGALTVRLHDNLFIGAEPMTVTQVSRTANVATITIAMPTVPRYDGETYTNHYAAVGAELRLTGMPTLELNGAFTVTAVTATTISFVSTAADLATTATPGGKVLNGSNRCITLTNPIEAAHIENNYTRNFRYFVDTSSAPGGSPYGVSGTSTYRGNQLAPVFGGNTLDFTSEPRDFNRVQVAPGSAHPGFDAMQAPLQAVQTHNRIQESDVSAWTKLGCTVTSGIANGLGGLTAFQIERTATGSALSTTFNAVTKKREYTLLAGVHKLLILSPPGSAPRQENMGVIQFRARAVETAEMAATCLCVGIIDMTSKLFSCFEVVHLLPGNIWPAKWFRIPFRYRNGCNPATMHVFVIPGFWFPHKATVMVDQVSVADVPCDFVRTTGTERIDTSLGNLWRQVVGMTGLRAVPGPEGPPTVALVGTPLGAGGSVQLVQLGTSMASTIQMNTGTAPAATGSLTVTIPKTLLNPVVLCSLESGTTAWASDARVHLAARITGTPNQTGLTLTWTQTGALTASTSNAVRINYWVVEMSNLGL